VLDSIDEPTGEDLALLAGGGECGRLIAAFDWTKTPLGPIRDWPRSLKTATGILLRSPIPIVMLWGESGVMIYNDAYSEFAGGRHPGLLGCNVREGWPEVSDFNDNVMKVGLSGGTLSYTDQELTLHRNGRPERVWMNLDYSPVPGDDGEPAGVIAIVVETTKRVLADRRDSSQRERFARLFDQAPGFMALLRGADHVFELVNPAYMQLVGHRDILGKPVAEALPEAAEQGFIRILDEIYRTGQPFVGRNIEVDLQRSPGAPLERRVVDFVYQPITEGSSVAGVFVEGSDITERARAEELRETQNGLLRDAVSNAPLKDILEKLVLAVEQRSTTGVLASILLMDEEGRHLLHGAAPNLPSAYNMAIDGLATGPVAGSCGTAAFRGEPVFVSDIASDPLWKEFKELAIEHGLRACWSIPILAGDGRVLGTFAMYHKQPRDPVESDLELVEFVTRTASLIIERSRSEVALRDALHAKEMLLHEVNHRVKNSLQVVTSLLMLQAGRAKEPALKQALLEARGRIGVVAGIHQRLYSTSQHDRVDFGNYLEELATESLRSLNNSGKIALDIDVGRDVVMPLTQAVPLALAVSELITNAVKYAFPGDRGGKLTVQLHDHGDRVEVCVSDNGIGLPEGFDPSAAGGLGMRIVTALVRQVRGTLSIESAEPGAEFVISVPLTTKV
jgi:PAS domain S-box-containing protein